MKTSHLIVVVVAALVCTAPARAVTIDMVTIGNPGNAPDTRYNSISVGAVGYAYRMGKYEVTAGQYTEFLNAVAKADPNELYTTAMVDANIQRTGSSPNFSYSVAADWGTRPVNYVSFWNAARFANWLQNGQPTGAQGPGTTEGGAYINVGDQATFARQPGAKFFVPTEDEWYKAAYHKNNGLSAAYWDYPTASNTAPLNTLPDPGNHANYAVLSGNVLNYTIGSPYYRTQAGEFANSPSPYGTFDQGGNLWEWNETVVNNGSRGVRGGSFDSLLMHMLAADRNFNSPRLESLKYGFRVAASIPEPGTLTLTIVGAALTIIRWGRSKVNSPADGNAYQKGDRSALSKSSLRQRIMMLCVSTRRLISRDCDQ